MVPTEKASKWFFANDEKTTHLPHPYLNKELALSHNFRIKGGTIHVKLLQSLFTYSFSPAQDQLVTMHTFLNEPFLAIEWGGGDLLFPFLYKVQLENFLLKSCSITSYGNA